VARDPDPTPTPIRPGASTASGQIDVEALEQLQAEVDRRARRWVTQAVGKLATWLGLVGGGAGTTYYATRPADAPTPREQPASGASLPAQDHEPRARECPPSADLIDAELDTQRDARLAVDACRELADEIRRKRQAKESQDP
jgi:hypothetical protein